MNGIEESICKERKLTYDSNLKSSKSITFNQNRENDSLFIDVKIINF